MKNLHLSRSLVMCEIDFIFILVTAFEQIMDEEMVRIKPNI